ncbi:hypothetical protein E0D81_07430 [Lelliottia amnigena]|uniref:hypothetical protein n=1 Tax=Lelliottia amnigena TaxID=61646 RepID=UPI00103A1519|nr:hypothetical protein [Lelliottia amnigena]MCE9963488.1 hypothetical protein [Lelliottia amnigena]TCD21942.1 hypothetical protein E0D81_07430 [Lelliottia amnigena]
MINTFPGALSGGFTQKRITRFDVGIIARGHVAGKPAGIKEIGVEVAARKLFFPESLLRPYFSSE